jgi:hypothetical protein
LSFAAPDPQNLPHLGSTEKEGFMLKNKLTYGAGAGLIVGIPLFAMTLAFKDNPPPEQFGMLIGYAIMLVALSLVFVAVKRHRDVDLGGVISFWRALTLGLGVSAVAGVLYVLAWEAAVAAAGPSFISDYMAKYIAQQQAAGLAGDALVKLTREMEAFQTQYANPLFRLPITFLEIFPVGVVVSLVSAGLLRNRNFLPARRG